LGAPNLGTSSLRATPAAAFSSWRVRRPEPVVLYSRFSVWSANSRGKWIDFIVEMSCVHAGWREGRPICTLNYGT
jgi:hypothetical protein